MTVFDRVKILADRKGWSIGDVEKKIGMGKNAIYKWKKQNAATDKLELIADLFDVSIDYLLGREGKSEAIPYKVENLDEALDNAMNFDGKPLTEIDKEAIRAFLQGRLSSK